MMLAWNNLADPHLTALSDFARFSQTLTLKSRKHATPNNIQLVSMRGVFVQI